MSLRTEGLSDYNRWTNRQVEASEGCIKLSSFKVLIHLNGLRVTCMTVLVVTAPCTTSSPPLALLELTVT